MTLIHEILPAPEGSSDMDSTWRSLSKEAPSTGFWPLAVPVAVAVDGSLRAGAGEAARSGRSSTASISDRCVRCWCAAKSEEAPGSAIAALPSGRPGVGTNVDSEREEKQEAAWEGERGRREQIQLDSIKLRVCDDTAGEGWLPATRRHARASAPVKRGGPIWLGVQGKPIWPRAHGNYKSKRYAQIQSLTLNASKFTV